jgi:hypothetical protein
MNKNTSGLISHVWHLILHPWTIKYYYVNNADLRVKQGPYSPHEHDFPLDQLNSILDS